MKNFWLLLCSLLFLVTIACKNGKKEKPASEKFFPVISIIKNQVAHVDTSLYSIRKVNIIDSITSDTVYYPREKFRELAAEFLQLPDISSADYSDRYKEEEQFDETLNRVIILYQPIKAEDERIQRQEVVIKPDAGGDKITSIIIDYLQNTKDSSVQKRMLWQVDKSFQVVSSKQYPGKPDVNSTYRVIWGEDEVQ